MGPLIRILKKSEPVIGKLSCSSNFFAIESHRYEKRNHKQARTLGESLGKMSESFVDSAIYGKARPIKLDRMFLQGSGSRPQTIRITIDCKWTEAGLIPYSAMILRLTSVIINCNVL